MGRQVVDRPDDRHAVGPQSAQQPLEADGAPRGLHGAEHRTGGAGGNELEPVKVDDVDVRGGVAGPFLGERARVHGLDTHAGEALGE